MFQKQGENSSSIMDHNISSNMSNSSDVGILNRTNGSLETTYSDFIELPKYLFVYMTTINVIVFIVGICGNLLVIAVVCQVRAMRNSTNYFLFTLSIADLCVLLVCQPVAIMEFYAKERWYIGEAMCKILHCHIYLFDIYIIYHSIYSFSNKTI